MQIACVEGAARLCMYMRRQRGGVYVAARMDVESAAIVAEKKKGKTPTAMVMVMAGSGSVAWPGRRGLFGLIALRGRRMSRRHPPESVQNACPRRELGRASPRPPGVRCGTVAAVSASESTLNRSMDGWMDGWVGGWVDG